MGGKTLLPFGLLAGAAALVLACSDRKTVVDDDSPDGPITSPYSGPELAGKIQAAIDAKGSYTVAVQQENLVLPRWGGSDGGSVTVGSDSGKATAVAELHRTGDGDYGLWMVDGQTYFKRSTCNDLTRIPGGAQTLAPFVLAGNKRISGGSNLKAANGRTTLMLTLEGLGDTEISFDPKTFLPNQLSSREATSNGKPLVWTFEKWGEGPDVDTSRGERSGAYDRGPGGNPC